MLIQAYFLAYADSKDLFVCVERKINSKQVAVSITQYSQIKEFLLYEMKYPLK